MLTTYEQKPKLRLSVTIAAIVVIAAIVLWADRAKSSKAISTHATSTQNTPQTIASQPTSSTSSNSNLSSPTPVTTNTSGYKDGSYTATRDYSVPHGNEEIKVTVALANGVVASASVQNSENDFDSASYQEEFASEYKSFVIGKKIDGLNLSVIAGASDTTEAFNEALNKIASQARV